MTESLFVLGVSELCELEDVSEIIVGTKSWMVFAVVWLNK